MTRAMKAILLSALLLSAPCAFSAEIPASVVMEKEGQAPPSATEAMDSMDAAEREELRQSDPLRHGTGKNESALLIVSAAALVIIALLLL